MANRNDLDDQWTAYAHERLAGRTIRSVRYMSAAEAESMMWSYRPIVLELDNGALIFPAADDEGNNGGALFGVHGEGNAQDEWTFPVMR